MGAESIDFQLTLTPLTSDPIDLTCGDVRSLSRVCDSTSSSLTSSLPLLSSWAPPSFSRQAWPWRSPCASPWPTLSSWSSPLTRWPLVALPSWTPSCAPARARRLPPSHDERQTPRPAGRQESRSRRPVCPSVPCAACRDYVSRRQPPH